MNAPANQQELDGARALGEIFQAMDADMEVLLPGRKRGEDDSTEFNFMGALQLLGRELGAPETARARGMLKALAWLLMVNVGGFGVSAEEFSAERALAEVAASADGVPLSQLGSAS